MVAEAVNAQRERARPRRLDLLLVARRPACRHYTWLQLDAPPDWQSLPGQFVNILCESDPAAAAASERRPLDDADGGEWPQATGLELGRKWPLVRRPLSVSRVVRDGGRVRLHLLVRTVGTGTRFLSNRPLGASVDVVGPLGNHFTAPEDDRLCLLVGGGCGMAPIFGLAEYLVGLGKPCVFILGAGTLDELPLAFGAPPPATGDAVVPCETLAEFPGGAVETLVATDDGSAGFHGTTVAALRKRLDALETDRPVALYGCGPERMLQALARVAERRGAPCQLSLEGYMGCGIGVCLSCARKRRDPTSEKGWTYRLTCREGPVVEARDVVWP